jgi:hypothetical protein
MAGSNIVSAAEAEEWEGEFIMNYGQSTSLLPQRCNQSGWMSGAGTVSFTIVENDQITTTRGANGDIVYRNSNQSEITVALQEALGAEDIDNFTAFKSSVDQRKIMYARVEGAIHRKMDDLILTELDGTPNSINSGDLPSGSGTIGFALLTKNALEVTSLFHSLTVGQEGVATGVLTVRGFAYLEQNVPVASRDYNDDMPLVKGYKPFTWQGVLWTPYARGTTGAGTNSGSCYLFHQTAVAFKEAGDVSMIVDFDKKNRKWFCNGQEWCAAKRLLDNGVLKFLHDDSIAFP